MSNDLGVKGAEAMRKAEDRQEGKREIVEKDKAKETLTHENAPDEITWGDVTGARDELNGWYSPYKHWLFEKAGIDGYGVEISFEVEAGIVIGGVAVEPVGVSILWITNSEVDASVDGVKVDPQDNPHYFLFASRSASAGFSLGADTGINVEWFYATHYGPDPITRASWAGPVVSVDVEGGLSLGIGAEGGGSYFSAVDYDKDGPYGSLDFWYPDSGWHGVSYSATFQTGLSLEIEAIGASATTAQENVTDFLGRPQVRKVFEEGAPDIPEEGDFHYQRDVTGGSFFGWLADAMGPNIDEELE